MNYNYIVIGGGFFGSALAIHLSNSGKKVLLIEKENDLLTKASVNNQARIHNGYHYPRSYKTAYSSHKNYQKFISDFKESCVSDFTMLYPIAYGSKTNSATFYDIYNKMGCPISIASSKDKSLFNFNKIEEVFEVDEIAFDGNVLRSLLKEKIKNTSVEIMSGCEVVSIYNNRVFTENNGFIESENIFLCTYSGTNNILRNSLLKEVDVITQNTRMPLVKLHHDFSKIGITIMDGGFFSIMPFPMEGCHSIHHVKYTPKSESWETFEKDVYLYIPSLIGKMKFIGDVWEKKVILPGNREDDGRPIFYKKEYGGNKYLTVILGGKLDNIYDIFDKIDGKDSEELNVI